MCPRRRSGGGRGPWTPVDGPGRRCRWRWRRQARDVTAGATGQAADAYSTTADADRTTEHADRTTEHADRTTEHADGTATRGNAGGHGRHGPTADSQLPASERGIAAAAQLRAAIASQRSVAAAGHRPDAGHEFTTRVGSDSTWRRSGSHARSTREWRRDGEAGAQAWILWAGGHRWRRGQSSRRWVCNASIAFAAARSTRWSCAGRREWRGQSSRCHDASRSTTGRWRWSTPRKPPRTRADDQAVVPRSELPRPRWQPRRRQSTRWRRQPAHDLAWGYRRGQSTGRGRQPAHDLAWGYRWEQARHRWEPARSGRRPAGYRWEPARHRGQQANDVAR